MPVANVGDCYGANRKNKSDNWGAQDKASKERARRRKISKEQNKRRREDERQRRFMVEANNAPHPQECPICQDELQTNLVWSCGMNDEPPYHRYHGYCLDCAEHVIESGHCFMCRQPVQGHWYVGTEFFAFSM